MFRYVLGAWVVLQLTGLTAWAGPDPIPPPRPRPQAPSQPPSQAGIRHDKDDEAGAAQKHDKLVDDRKSHEVLPPPTVVQSDREAYRDSIAGMLVTDNYPTRYPDLVQPGKAPTEYEAELLNDLVHRTGRFADPKYKGLRPFAILGRFNFANDDVMNNLIEVYKQGGYSQLITDFSRTSDSPKVVYEVEGELRRFSKMYELTADDFNDSKKGKTIAAMLRAGAQFPNPTTGKLNPRFGITGLMYQEQLKVENPLMHEKFLLVGFMDDTGKIADIYGTLGTNNMVPHQTTPGKDPGTRSDRMIIQHDQRFLKFVFDHAMALRDTFAKGGAAVHIPPMPPLLEIFKNGDKVYSGYTDGKYNLHDRTAMTLLRSVMDQPDVLKKVTDFNHPLAELIEREQQTGELPKTAATITKVKMKTFLLTNRSVFEALKLAMKANPDLTLEGTIDQEFAGLETQGLMGPLFGYTGMREFGGNMRGEGPNIWRRNHLKIYQRMIDGAVEKTRLESWAVHYLLHDKTIMMWVKEKDGTEKVHIFTGSYNMSSHVDNNENLQELILDPSDPLVAAFEESIDEPIKREPQWYIDGHDAIFRDAIGRITGHTEMEVKMSEVDDLKRFFHEQNYAQVRKMLEEIANRPSTLDNYPQMTPDRIKARIDRLMGFLQWQGMADKDIFEARHFETLDFRLAGVAVLLANQDPLDKDEFLRVRREPWQAFDALHSLLFKPEYSGEDHADERKARETEVWQKWLQMGEVPVKPRRDSEARDPHAPPPEDTSSHGRGGNRAPGPRFFRPGSVPMPASLRDEKPEGQEEGAEPVFVSKPYPPYVEPSKVLLRAGIGSEPLHQPTLPPAERCGWGGVGKSGPPRRMNHGDRNRGLYGNND